MRQMEHSKVNQSKRRQERRNKRKKQKQKQIIDQKAKTNTEIGQVKVLQK